MTIIDDTITVLKLIRVELMWSIQKRGNMWDDRCVNLLVEILLQCISNHHLVRLTFIVILFVDYTWIKLRKKKIKGQLARKKKKKENFLEQNAGSDSQQNLKSSDLESTVALWNTDVQINI